MSAPVEPQPDDPGTSARALLANLSERSYDLKLKAALVYAILDVAAAIRGGKT